MKSRFLYLILYVCLLPLAGCNVHEWPDLPENVQVHLQLRYDTDWTMKEYEYESRNASENSRIISANSLIRYIVRAYPLASNGRAAEDYTHEFIFTKTLDSHPYDYDVTLNLHPGEYKIAVWSDFLRRQHDEYMYDASDFTGIALPKHQANTDYRDAFRGSADISLLADYTEKAPDTLTVQMRRPLAKFEFITSDVEKFVQKEATRVASKSKANGETSDSKAMESPESRVNLEEYRIVFYYVGFMPDVFNLFTDKPVDSATGILYESSINKLNEEEASLGFDYVFVNGVESSVTLQIGIFDSEGTQLNMSEPIEVPIKRSQHTVMRGMFLMSETFSGVAIDPSFDGDYDFKF